ncbi:MAG TPA: energy transducer TonB, partial [Vicinamibacterales bacterium]
MEAFPYVSFTPGAPLRRSFKEDRDERRRRKEARQRLRVIIGVAVLLLMGSAAWALYEQPGITGMLGNWQKPRATPRAIVLMHTLAYKPIKPLVDLTLKPSPTPGITPTPLPTSTPVATPTPTPAPKKTPKPKTTAIPLRSLRPFGVAVSTPFGVPPTPAVLATPVPTPAPATPAPATPTPNAEVYAPQVVVDARFANRVQPEYPEVAREQNIQGTAIVLVTVGPKGNVISQRLERSAGHPLLDQAALSAAAHSSFLPPKIDGKPAT